MIFTDTLIHSIKEWDEVTGEQKVSELPGLISIALAQLGSNPNYQSMEYQSNPLEYLKNRIEEIQSNEGIFESFLVDGVISLFNNYLKDQISKRDSFIKNNEALLKMADETLITSNVIRETEKQISILKSDQYLPLANNQLSVWDNIISRNFSLDNRNQMDRKIILEGNKAFKENMTTDIRLKFNNLINNMKD